MAKDELKKDLVRHALAEMRKHDRIFSPAVEKEVRELVSLGVEKMFDEVKNDSEHIELARANASQFIDKLCKKNKSRVIDKRAFHAARVSLCPVWPYCE